MSLRTPKKSSWDDELLFDTKFFNFMPSNPLSGHELSEIKDKSGFDTPTNAFPEGKKIQYLIVGLISIDVCIYIQDKF